MRRRRSQENTKFLILIGMFAALFFVLYNFNQVTYMRIQEWVYKKLNIRPASKKTIKTRGYEYKVTPLVNKDYYHALHESFRKAQKSIYVAMYLIDRGEDRPGNPVNILLQDLVDARERGVDVKTVLECPEDVTLELYRINRKTISYLNKQKIKKSFVKSP